MTEQEEANIPGRPPGWTKKFYAQERTEVNAPFRKLLEQYAKIPSDEVVTHVNDIVRDPITRFNSSDPSSQ
jgi:hypothetical protein